MAFLAAVPARSLTARRRRGATSRLHATEWQNTLDDIDGDAWRDLRRELYGAPDAVPPKTLARFGENRRKSLEEEVIEDLGPALAGAELPGLGGDADLGRSDGGWRWLDRSSRRQKQCGRGPARDELPRVQVGRHLFKGWRVRQRLGHGRHHPKAPGRRARCARAPRAAEVHSKAAGRPVDPRALGSRSVGADVPHHAGGARPHGRGRRAARRDAGRGHGLRHDVFHSAHNEHLSEDVTSSTSTFLCRPTNGMRSKRCPATRGGAAAARRGAVAVRRRARSRPGTQGRDESCILSWDATAGAAPVAGTPGGVLHGARRRAPLCVLDPAKPLFAVS